MSPATEHTLQIARGLASQGQLDAALTVLRPLANATPTDTRTLNLLGSLLLQTGHINDAILTLERAAPLTTDSGIPWINLGHALRKAQRRADAVKAFQSGTRLSPLEPEGFVGLGEALLESSQFASSHQAFARALTLMTERSPQRERARAGHFATAPFWWQPHRYGPVELRPLTPDDVPFFAECCADRAFMDRFNAPQTPNINRQELTSSIEQEAMLAPVQRGNVKWVAWSTRAKERIGLAGLPSFHLLHQRAEVAGGVRGPCATPGTGTATWLAVLDFAFEKLGVHKAQALVYHTNQPAQRQLLSLGFHEEGVLKDHIRLASGQWLHLHSLALFRSGWCSTPRLTVVRKRFTQTTTPQK